MRVERGLAVDGRMGGGRGFTRVRAVGGLGGWRGGGGRRATAGTLRRGNSERKGGGGGRGWWKPSGSGRFDIVVLGEAESSHESRLTRCDHEEAVWRRQVKVKGDSDCRGQFLSSSSAALSTFSQSDPPAQAPIPTPIHAKLATTNVLSKPSPQQRQRQLEPQPQPPPDDDERWEVLNDTHRPPIVVPERSSSMGSLSPSVHQQQRPASPALTSANRQDPRRKLTGQPTAPAALGILASLSPPQPPTRPGEINPRNYSEERFASSDRASLIDTQPHLEPSKPKEKHRFWSRGDKDRKEQPQPPPQNPPRQEQTKERNDEPGDLTRRIGELISLAPPASRLLIPCP